jgi:hypothetical protein
MLFMVSSRFLVCELFSRQRFELCSYIRNRASFARTGAPNDVRSSRHGRPNAGGRNIFENTGDQRRDGADIDFAR